MALCLLKSLSHTHTLSLSLCVFFLAAHVRRQSIALAVQHHSEEQHRRLLAKRAKLRMKRDAQLAAEGQRPIAEEVEADSGDPPPPSSAPPLDGNDDDDANDPPPPSSAPPPPTDEAAVDPPPPAVETTTDEEEDITELTPLESADEDEEEEEEEEEEEDEEETEAHAEAHAEAKGEAKTTAERSDEWVSPRTRTVQAQVSDILSSLQDDHAAQQALMQASRDRLARRRAKIHAHREHVAAVVQHFDALGVLQKKNPFLSSSFLSYLLSLAYLLIYLFTYLLTYLLTFFLRH